MARALVLGGTGLIGPSIVETLQARGHSVSVFNRNRRNPDAFRNIEQLVGDRNEPVGHNALKGKKWDIVFDIPTTNPRWIVDAAAILKGNVGHYVYVSSTAAFKDVSIPYQDETAPTADPAPIEPQTPAAQYGNLKARCEQLVMENYGSGGIVVRPGYIVGRRDGTGRWLPYALRIQRGGEVLAPGKMDDAAQYIDVRDLAEFMVKLAEDKNGGIFNATGPQTVFSVAEMLYGIKAAFSNDARFTWIDSAFLRENRVGFAIVLPKTSSAIVYSASSIEKAKAAGLTFRPLVDTARDGIAWYNALPEGTEKVRAAGLEVRPNQTPFTAEREKEVLAAWHAKQGTK